MKLYATTTSERASKGQGGNKFLDILIKDGEQHKILKIDVKPSQFGLYQVSITNDKGVFIQFYTKAKGKKQKGDQCICIDGVLNRKCTAKIHNW